MSLLEQLWDDTLAGPRPEKGLGKLRKHSTFSFRSNSGIESEGGNVSVRSDGGDVQEEPMKVTRSIMIVKPPGHQADGTPPVSPAGSTPPVSPFSGGKDSFRFRRKSAVERYEYASGIGPRSPPPPYDL